MIHSYLFRIKKLEELSSSKQKEDKRMEEIKKFAEEVAAQIKDYLPYIFYNPPPNHSASFFPEKRRTQGSEHAIYNNLFP